MNQPYACIFPGQGSQAVGMLGEIAKTFPQIKTTFAEASEVLGFDLWQLTQQGPTEKLNLTENTQPALLVASCALYRLMEANGYPAPTVMAGHSLGEYSALVCANAMDFSDAVAIVKKRGELMQAAVPANEGAMAALLGLSLATVEECCEKAAVHGIVAPANINAPGQIVIAGQAKAVEACSEIAKEKGAKRVVPLPVSVPSHSPLMEGAAKQLEIALNAITIKIPTLPVFHNVDGEVKETPAAIKAALVSQLHQPVQWINCIENMSKSRIDLFVECGPGKVLMGLNRRINRDFTTHAIESPEVFASLKTRFVTI